MLTFLVRRLLRGLVALFLFQTLLFSLIHAVPGDFAVFASFGGGPDLRAFLQRYYGLDRPLWEQYGNWMLNFLRLDLGESYMFRDVPVTSILLSRAPRTLLLFLSAALLAFLLGFWLGKVIAWRRGGWLEAGVTLGGVAGYTSFAPWLAFLVVNVFAWYLGWFPYEKLVDYQLWIGAPVTIDWLLARMVVSAALALATFYLVVRLTAPRRYRRLRLPLRLGALAVIGLVTALAWQASGYARLAVDILYHLVLPLGTVVLLSFGETMMLMRTTMLETLNEDYVVTARAKGLSERAIRDRHVARNAILPVLTRLTLSLPFVLVGSLVIEYVFLWRGMGQILFQAIEFHDIPVLMGILSFVGVLALAAHILLDVLYVVLDPRLRHRAAEGGYVD